MPTPRSIPPPRPSAVPVPAEEIIVRLEALADELAKRRWTAHVTAEPWRGPRLFVGQSKNPVLREHYVAAPDDSTGEWFFWDEAGKPVAPADAPRTAANVIEKALIGRARQSDDAQPMGPVMSPEPRG